MHVGVQGLMNALSLKTVAMQTHRDLESAVLKGRFAGGRCYGYSTVRAFDAAGTPIKGEREIDPAEAEIVVRIFEEYAEGKSGKAIAAGLNKDGASGPRGGIWRQNTINGNRARGTRSEAHTSELQSLMRTTYAVFCLKNKNQQRQTKPHYTAN